jgi:hypothetical protein
MKVTLDKQIQLRSSIVYLRFEKEVNRKDIQEYLNGKRFENSLIENRIKEYLKNIKVFDEKYQLTRLGNAVKESGMLPTVEEGKYQIWFTNEDSHFGNKIFYFKRVQPNRESNDDKINLKFSNEGHFYLPTENNSFSKLKLLPITDYFGQNMSNKDLILLRWIWNNLEKSNYIFDGQLGKGEGSIKLIGTPIASNENLKTLIEELLPEWDKNNERLRAPLNEISDQSKLSFEDNRQTKWRDFQVQLEKIPLMPYNFEDAKKWRNWLLIELLRKDYLNPSEFANMVIDTNENNAFKPYLKNLDYPKPEIFSSSIKKDTLAFWHLNAPLDLNPNLKSKLSAKSIELKKDEKVSFKNISSKLGFNNIHGNSVCIYYDRYVIREYQHKAVAALLESIECKNKIVITDITTRENGSDFIQKHKSEIKIKDSNSIFKNRSAHDRYLIIGNKDEIQIWNISNSIDYITFSDRNIDMNTIGIIRQSVVFTSVSKELLDKELINYLEYEIKNGK